MPIPALQFRLSGAGWAELEILAAGGQTTVPSISYCTDALDDLVRIGISIATDTGIGSAIFDHEPALTALVAETAWIEKDDWQTGARISVIRDLPARIEPSFAWRASVEADFVAHFDSRDELARLFLDAALRIQQKHGEEGYRKLWGGRLGFPRRAVAALDVALSIVPQEIKPYG